jgi:hypothetical protein
VLLGEDVVEERRLPGTEEAGEDGDRYRVQRCFSFRPFKTSSGVMG